MKKIFYFILIILISPLIVFSQKSKEKKTVSSVVPVAVPQDLNTYFKPMKWRSIGPFRGGRSVTASGVRGDITTYYMGTTGGGLWKTEDMGLNWRNISDGYFKTGSVGAVAVAESDPNIIYVGMGEHAVRGVMTHH
ncbi:MAG: glycosyl hydrolase, partial [Saprospiraceae bacterium]